MGLQVFKEGKGTYYYRHKTKKMFIIRPKKKLFDWRNPTDPIFTADPKYFYFFVCKKKKKKKFKNPVKQIFSFNIAIWYEYEDIQNDK